MRHKTPRNTYLPFSLALSLCLAVTLGGAWAESNQAPGLAIARFALPEISPHVDALVPTGTMVGDKVAETKAKLQCLEADTASIMQATRDIYEKVILEVNQYHKLLSGIEAKLQLGTTPSNPQLVELKNKASQQFSQIASLIDLLNRLAQDFLAYSEQTHIMRAQIDQTLTLPGAVDEDHAQLILIAQALEQLDSDIRQVSSIAVANTGRQNEWIAMEQARFESVCVAIERGRFLTTPPKVVIAQAASQPAPLLPVKTLTPVRPAPRVQLSPAVAEASLESAPAALPVLEPLPLLSVEARPALPVVAEAPFSLVLDPADANESESISLEIQPSSDLTPYAEVIQGRTPLGMIEASQHPRTQKWYLYSCARRGLENASQIIDVVTVTNQASSTQGEAIKAELVQLGLKPEQIRIINASGEGETLGKIYLLGGR